MKSQDTRIEKILEATGVMGEGEGSPILRTGNKKGIRCLSSGLGSWKTCRDARNSEKK